MATWHGEILEIDPKWLTGHETECDFAKLNSEVLTLIHEKKRFPTKNEFAEMQKAQPSTWADIINMDEPVENLWGVLPGVYGVGIAQDDVFTWDNASSTTFTVEGLDGTSPAAGNTTITTYGETVSWDGISWEDYAKDENLKNTGYQVSALASIKGITSKNLNHHLI